MWSICIKHEGKIILLIAAIIKGINWTILKYLYSKGLPVDQAVFARYYAPLIITVIYGIYAKYIKKNTDWNIFSSNRKSFLILSIRSFFHCLANAFNHSKPVQDIHAK
eukprot:679508_1